VSTDPDRAAVLQSRLRHSPWADPRYRRLPGVQPLDPADFLLVDDAFAGQMGVRDGLIAHHPEAVHALAPQAVPAARELLFSLLLAEFSPPLDSDGSGLLLRARVDKLLEFGALDQAQSLLEAAGGGDAELFRRRFDIALLLGNETRACTEMAALPAVAPSYGARIFCLARSGDWPAAALTLGTARVLGLLEPDEAQILGHFLDPEAEDLPETMPDRPTPLQWRMLDAVGETLPTTNLPLAFAHVDLRATAPWRSQVEAAERLTRTGALTPNRLLGLYTERRPAASGGVWDRIETIQRLESALAVNDADAVAEALMRAWPRMQTAELEMAFAALYAEPLSAVALEGRAASLRLEVALLADGYETAARDHPPRSEREAFLVALADGRPETAPPSDPMAAAIAEGFAAGPDALPGPISAALSEGRLGEAVLAALDRLARAAHGDLRGVVVGIATLRALGLEDTARRAALQMMVLERRG
jgi:hypothetical protein